MSTSWEFGPANEPPRRDRSGGSPLMLVGYTLGVLAASTNVFLYFWLISWLAPLMLAGLLALASLLPPLRRLLPVAEGAFAAAVFAAVLVCTLYLGLGAVIGS